MESALDTVGGLHLAAAMPAASRALPCAVRLSAIRPAPGECLVRSWRV